MVGFIRSAVILVLVFSMQHQFSTALSFPNPRGYGVIGFGSCPVVKPMENFDITKLFGGKWFLVAHYSETYVLPRHCLALEFSDDTPGKDLCRIYITNNSTEYATGERKRLAYYRLLPDVTQPSVLLNTFLDGTTKSIVLDTDYDEYILWHECIQYPRDNPVFYEQHNYIHSRTADWKDADKKLQEAYKVYESFGIDTRQFIVNDQVDCKQ